MTGSTPPENPSSELPNDSDALNSLEQESDEANLRDYAVEDYAVLAIFWVLAVVVFAQFFSRYVLNSSIAWTEEGARYLLICVGFLGSVMAARKNSHIFVEFFYRWLPRPVGRTLFTLVDFIRIAFFGVATWLSWKIFPIMQNQRMTALDLPMSVIYALVIVSFALMTVRSVQVAWRHWREGYVPTVQDDSDEGPAAFEGT